MMAQNDPRPSLIQVLADGEAAKIDLSPLEPPSRSVEGNEVRCVPPALSVQAMHAMLNWDAARRRVRYIGNGLLWNPVCPTGGGKPC